MGIPTKSQGIWLLILMIQIMRGQLAAVPIELENSVDYELLHHFFKMGIAEEEYGYVLEGCKPISARQFYAPASFLITRDQAFSEQAFATTLLVREAIPVWNRLCSHQTKFVLKATPDESGMNLEVRFIHLPLLQQVIQENIDLFRYVLGVTLESKELAERIAYSDEPLSEILGNSPILDGIVLGFGSHNSLLGGRSDAVQMVTAFSADTAPFAPKALPIADESWLFAHYLDVAGGSHLLGSFKEHYPLPKPALGFSTISQELAAIEERLEPLPPCLLEDDPKFIFGAYVGGPSNEPLFATLQKAQKQTQALLQSSDFLEQVLAKISGEAPLIACVRPACSAFSLAFFKGRLSLDNWSCILNDTMKEFNGEKERKAFLDSLMHSRSMAEAPNLLAVNETTLKGLNTALDNLKKADAYFELLVKDQSLTEMVPKQLYYKTLSEGNGKKALDLNRVRVGYVISDSKGEILFANCDTWLNLADTLPSFAKGLTGMSIGEKRQIFIHPVIGYGVLTTLPPCTELIVTVKLLDREGLPFKPMPIVAWNLDWLHQPAWRSDIVGALKKRPSFVGSFYSLVLDKIEGPNKGAIVTSVKS